MIPRKQKVWRYSPAGKFSHALTFGSTAPTTPLGRTPQYIHDQGTSNYCTAFARAAAGSYIFGQDMAPEYQTAMEGAIAGSPIFDGADPQNADTASEEYGFCPIPSCPLSFQTDGWQIPAEWQEYPATLDAITSQFNGIAPYDVNPTYDGIKAALQSGIADNAPVIANGFWFNEWQNPIGGIIPTPASAPITRHGYLFIDWIDIGGNEYLVAQLSSGTSFGVEGCVYMSADCVNTAFTKPLFNGVGCEIFRKKSPNPIQQEITLYQHLVIVLGEIVGMMKSV